MSVDPIRLELTDHQRVEWIADQTLEIRFPIAGFPTLADGHRCIFPPFRDMRPIKASHTWYFAQTYNERLESPEINPALAEFMDRTPECQFDYLYEYTIGGTTGHAHLIITGKRSLFVYPTPAPSVRRQPPDRDPKAWCPVGGLVYSFHSAYDRLHFRLNAYTDQGDQGPIPGARVRWRPVATNGADDTDWSEGSTDLNGRFSVPEVRSGTWEVEVCAEGYRPMRGTIRVDAGYRIPDPTLAAIPAARAAAERITVLEPSSVVQIDVGTPVTVKWRIEHGPPDPEGWEVRVSLLGCADDLGIKVIHTEPFRKSEGRFTWRASEEVVDLMKGGDAHNRANGYESAYSSNGDLQLPIMVCLYNAGDRKRSDDFDESLTMFEACHPFGDPAWLVCGSTDQVGPGRISLPALRPAEARRRYEAEHPGVLHVAGEVTPPNVVDRVEPDWKDRGSHQPVVLEAVISTKGWVDDPIIVSAERPAVGRAALEALERWKYEPATLDGKPVAVFVTVVLTP